MRLEIRNLIGKVVGINRTEKVNRDGDSVETYKVTIEFDDSDYKVKATITTEDAGIIEDFHLNQEFRLSIQPANRKLSDF
ncbi:hypothetical protein [Archaeoglobus sp.]